MKKNYSFFIFLLGLVFFCSCVSQKKYRQAMSDADARQQELIARNNQLSDNITQLKAQIESLQTDNAKLIKQIDDAMKRASDASGMANMTQKQLEAEQQRLWDLRKRMDEQRQAVEALRKKMADALTGFTSNELQV